MLKAELNAPIKRKSELYTTQYTVIESVFTVLVAVLHGLITVALVFLFLARRRSFIFRTAYLYYSCFWLDFGGNGSGIAPANSPRGSTYETGLFQT